MKKKSRIILCILCILMLTGCTQEKSISQNLRIGICVYDQYDIFISSLVEHFNAAAKEKERDTGVSISVNVVGAGGKQTTQNDQVETFIENDYDILCVNLVDRTDASMVIDKAKNANVPVIFFNRELVQEDLERWDRLYYVGSVTQEAGIMQGQIIVDLCSGAEGITPYDKNGDGVLQYLMLEGEAGHQDALVRTEYAVKTITEAGIPLEKIGDEIANWNRAQAKTKMNQWLEQFSEEIDLVISNNDDMALGAIDALWDYGMEDWPLIVGIDGMEGAIEAIEEGVMSGTVLNDARGQAESMLELAYSIQFDTELPEGTELENDIYIRKPNEIITKENVEQVREYLDEK